jgi:hypothetical protein
MAITYVGESSARNFFDFSKSVGLWPSFRQGRALSQVGDGEDVVQMLRVAVNILNKQSWIADKGWSSGRRVGWRAYASSSHKAIHYEILHTALDLPGSFEHGNELCEIRGSHGGDCGNYCNW